jgi:hypothetical protein
MTDDDRIRHLERELEILRQEVAALRLRLAQLEKRLGGEQSPGG